MQQGGASVKFYKAPRISWAAGRGDGGGENHRASIDSRCGDSTERCRGLNPGDNEGLILRGLTHIIATITIVLCDDGILAQGQHEGIECDGVGQGTCRAWCRWGHGADQGTITGDERDCSSGDTAGDGIVHHSRECDIIPALGRSRERRQCHRGNVANLLEHRVGSGAVEMGGIVSGVDGSHIIITQGGELGDRAESTGGIERNC